jgi:hypothetical protein
MITTYEPTMTMRDARARYFDANGFGPNGGYDDAWVDFSLGPIPFPFPQTAGRVRAVRYHDLHHILTDYDTNFVGELEISAWEIGAGCKDFVAAWQLNLSGMAGGLFLAPRRTFAAFVRGRRSRSLYGEDFEPLLDAEVGATRREFVAPEPGPATAADVALFAAACAVGLVLGLAFFAVALPLAPFGLLTSAWLKAKRAKAAAPSARPA